MFAAKDKADAELGHVVREKMRVGGSKFTATEARYVWATFWEAGSGLGVFLV
jgi:hypothetical protein